MKCWVPVLLAAIFAFATTWPAWPNPIPTPKDYEDKREREERRREKEAEKARKRSERAARAAKVKKPGELRRLVWNSQPGNSPRRRQQPQRPTGTNIALAGEIVLVDLTKNTAHVTGTYWLRNTSNVQETLSVRFPVGSDANAGSPTVSNFKAAVDGRLLQVAAGRDGQIGPWYGWSMAVYPLQTRVLTVEYDCDMSSAVPRAGSRNAAAGAREFTYRLDTGAGWAGQIGLARIIVRLNDEAARRVEAAGPNGAVRYGDTLVWQFSQFEPTKAHNISVRYGADQDKQPGLVEDEQVAATQDTPDNTTNTQ